jgi:hypothetical protein
MPSVGLRARPDAVRTWPIDTIVQLTTLQLACNVIAD